MIDDFAFLILDFKVAVPDFPEHEMTEFAGFLYNANLELLEGETFRIQNNNKIGINFFDAIPKISSLIDKSQVLIFHDTGEIIHKILSNKFSLQYKVRGVINTAKHLPLDIFEKKQSVLDWHIRHDLHYIPGKSCMEETLRVRSLLKYFGLKNILNRSNSKVITVILDDISRIDGSEISKKIGFEFREGCYRRKILECDLTLFEEYCKKTNLILKII